MKAVGIKILKAKLSEYLRLVKTGETILVTERDEVVAELRPTSRQKVTPTTLDESLDMLAQIHSATLRTEEVGKWSGPQLKIKLKNITSKKILDSLRGN